MMKPILFSIFTLFFLFSQAQTGVNTGLISSNDRYQSKPAKGYLTYEEIRAEYENIQGSPYLHNGRIDVDFELYNDSMLHDVNIEYDLYHNEIIVYKEGGDVIILDQIFYKRFIYKKGTPEQQVYERVNDRQRDFYEVLFQKEGFIFCKKDKVKVVEEQRHVPGQDILPQKFTHKMEYFFKYNDELIEVTLSKEKALEMLPENYKDQLIAVKEKLGLKKVKREKDYIQLLRAFD